MIAQIAAIQKKDRGLGYKGSLLYQIPEDMARFREITKGSPVIMGRATWESLPDKFRPLPGRTNIVVTRDTHYDAPGAKVTHSIEQALDLAKTLHPEPCTYFIIGGGQIYEAALPFSDRLYLTLVDGDKPADAFFPDYSAFTKVVSEEKHPEGNPPYTFITLER